MDSITGTPERDRRRSEGFLRETPRPAAVAEASRSKELAAPLYEPLDPSKKEIRLLQIHPALHAGAEVRVRISKHSLDQARQLGFIPLSYVWGDPSYTEQAYANGQPVRIGKNLATLLRHLRDVLQFSSSRFWADALCIDQANVPERNQQVALMKDIYGTAHTVFCWPGMIDGIELAAELLRVIYYEWFLPAREHYGGRLSNSEIYDSNLGGWMQRYPYLFEENEPGGMRNRHFNALQRLFDAEYWCRVWTFQETVLPDQALILTGSSAVVMELIAPFSHWCRCMRSQQICPVAYNHIMVCIYHNHPVEGITNRLRGYYSNQPGLAHVSMGIGLRASDPRDHVFGMLGLLDTDLVADYSRTFEEVYKSVCSTWYNESGNIGFLLFAGLSSQEPISSLPSWVPDWRTWGGGTKNLAPRMSFYTHDLRSSGARFSEFGNVLSLSGILVEDAVSMSTPPLLKDVSSTADALFDFTAAFVARTGSRKMSNGTDIIQALFRLACGDRAVFGEGMGPEPPPLDLESHDIHRMVIHFLHVITRATSEDDMAELQETRLSQLGIDVGPGFATQCETELFPGLRIPQMQHWSDWTTAVHACEAFVSLETRVNFWNSVVVRLGNCVLFETENGRIGAATKSVKIGDRFAVFTVPFEADARSSHAFLLRPRPSGERFELVGMCDVFGLDDESLRKGNVREIELV